MNGATCGPAWPGWDRDGKERKHQDAALWCWDRSGGARPRGRATGHQLAACLESGENAGHGEQRILCSYDAFKDCYSLAKRWLTSGWRMSGIQHFNPFYQCWWAFRVRVPRSAIIRARSRQRLTVRSCVRRRAAGERQRLLAVRSFANWRHHYCIRASSRCR